MIASKNSFVHYLKLFVFYLQQIGLEIIFPNIIYIILKPIIGDVYAALYMPVPNVVSILLTLVFYRLVEVLSILILLFYLAGSLATFFLNDPLLSQLASCIINITIGLGFLLTEWFAPKPLAFYFGRPWFTKNQKELILWWNSRWGSANFRTELKWNSYVWGVGFILLGSISLVLLYTLELDLAVIVVLVFTLAGFAGMGCFTYIYAGVWRKRDLRAEVAKNQGDFEELPSNEIVLK
jgi:intracellular septation protein A